MDTSQSPLLAREHSIVTKFAEFLPYSFPITMFISIFVATGDENQYMDIVGSADFWRHFTVCYGKRLVLAFYD